MFILLQKVISRKFQQEINSIQNSNFLNKRPEQGSFILYGHSISLFSELACLLFRGSYFETHQKGNMTSQYNFVKKESVDFIFWLDSTTIFGTVVPCPSSEPRGSGSIPQEGNIFSHIDEQALSKLLFSMFIGTKNQKLSKKRTIFAVKLSLKLFLVYVISLHDLKRLWVCEPSTR